jgi:GNAT superfamily N-acetyltransferase
VLDDHGRLVGVATFASRPYPDRPGVAAVQLRGMAVETAQHGRGIGQLLLTAAMDRLRAQGTELLWAKARDQALGFYERLGMHVEGDGYITADTRLPHHTVVIELI